MSNAAKGSKTVIRTITLEEHFATATFMNGPGAKTKARPDAAQLVEMLCNLGDRRIADMDAAGIDVQVLTLTAPGVEQLDAAEAQKLARETNEILAEAVRRYPSRFVGFATLPTPSPKAAADELERMVREHHFKGGVVNGHIRGRYLDDPFFWPILERAEALQVPLYLHPTPPPKAVIEASYTGNFSAEVTDRFSTAGWGWHIETAMHTLRIILGGVFDKYPRLQFIIGHLGEGIPFMLPRIDRSLPMATTKLRRPISAYLRENLHYSLSGFNFTPTFLDLFYEIGADRIMFSADYPYGSMPAALAFLEQLPISPADKEKIAHTNAERLMGI